jgi:hypothetical protein
MTAAPEPVAAVLGTWALAMRTPVGTMHATMTFRHHDGVLVGTAQGKAERVPLRDLRWVPGADGGRLTWSQTITSPMRLHLDFDVTVDGDHMVGQSRAGRLPRSAVAGTRVAAA